MKSLPGRVSFVLLVTAFLTAPLYAQLKMLKSEPAANSTNSFAPRQIQVWFDQSVQGSGGISLTGPGGIVKLASPVIDGASISASVVGVLPDGAYLASWHAAGADGRIQRGQFKFTVKMR